MKNVYQRLFITLLGVVYYIYIFLNQQTCVFEMVPPTMLDINIGTVCQNQCKFVTFVEVRRPVYSSKLEIISNLCKYPEYEAVANQPSRLDSQRPKVLSRLTI